MFFVTYLYNTAEDVSGQSRIWNECEDIIRTYADSEPDASKFYR